MALYRSFMLANIVHVEAVKNVLDNNWRYFAEKGKPLVVTVHEHESKRSNDQNRRMWMLLGVMAEQAWVGGKQYDAETWHNYLKMKFLGSIDLPDGTKVPVSSTRLSVGEMANYMNQIEQYAVQELGVQFDL